MSDDQPRGLRPAMVPEDRQVGPELLRALEALADDVARLPHDRDLAHRFEWLVDVLVLRGHLAPGHRKLIDRIKAGDGKVHLATYHDKRSVVGHDIDCAARMHLCRARCCSFTVSLSLEDLAEGKLGWDVFQPYLLPKDPDTGYCTCLDADGRCGAYEHRPGTCRAYDCRNDARVWIDFEARIPAPLPPRLRPPAAIAARDAPTPDGER